MNRTLSGRLRELKNKLGKVQFGNPKKGRACLKGVVAYKGISLQSSLVTLQAGCHQDGGN